MVVLKISQNSQENMCQSHFLNKVAGLRPETLAQAFSCEFCEIFKNNFCAEYLRETASVNFTYRKQSNIRLIFSGIFSKNSKIEKFNFQFLLNIFF